VGPSRDLWSVTDASTGETVEAAIIVSVLLSFVEQLMTTGRLATATDANSNHGNADITDGDRDREYNETNPLLRRDVRVETGPLEGVEAEERMKRLISRMKIQIWAGMGSGLLIATGIGAAFIAIVRSPLQHWAVIRYID
jgi:high-affinity iron transporter